MFHLLIHQIFIEHLLYAGIVLEAEEVAMDTSQSLPKGLLVCVCVRGDTFINPILSVSVQLPTGSSSTMRKYRGPTLSRRHSHIWDKWVSEGRFPEKGVFEPKPT